MFSIQASLGVEKVHFVSDDRCLNIGYISRDQLSRTNIVNYKKGVTKGEILKSAYSKGNCEYHYSLPSIGRTALVLSEFPKT